MSPQVVLLMLSLLVLGSTGQEAPKSIAKIVSDLLQVPDPVPSIKEWTIDWQADLTGDETRAAITPLHQAIDLTKLMEDILIGKTILLLFSSVLF